MKVLMVSALLYAAGGLQTGAAAPAYDASFVLEQGTYTGTTTFAVAKSGEVTGTMKLVSPIEVDAALSGTVKGDTWTFEYPYTIAQEGCSGTVKGTGTISKDRATITGDVVIGGACVEAPTSATFTFTRRK